MDRIHPLKAWRESCHPKMSQDELAKRLGVKQATVCRWEKGVQNPAENLVPLITRMTGIAAKRLRPGLAFMFEVARLRRRKAA